MKTKSLNQVEITKPLAEDLAGWSRLYADYASDYKWNESKTKILWSWLNDSQHQVNGFFAKSPSDGVVGFIHFQEIPRAIHARNQGYIDDLYVAPKYRGTGVAEALISAVVEIARQKGWTTIRWISREDNYRARALYDRLATKTDRIIYELTIT